MKNLHTQTNKHTNVQIIVITIIIMGLINHPQKNSLVSQRSIYFLILLLLMKIDQRSIGVPAEPSVTCVGFTFLRAWHISILQ
jgi:hypothetical protein